MNTDLNSVRSYNEYIYNFVDTLVQTISMPIYCKKYNFRGFYNECIYNNLSDSNLIVFSSAETFKSSDRRKNMVGAAL